MSQAPPGWGPQPPHRPAPLPPNQVRRRGKFWLAIGIVWLATFSCTAMIPAEDTSDAKAPARTATSTISATPTTNAKPAPAVTETKKVSVKVTKTVTAAPGPADDADSDTGGGSIYYDNCADARAQGAAPVRRGEPGYGRHLDRDGDGTGCD